MTISTMNGSLLPLLTYTHWNMDIFLESLLSHALESHLVSGGEQGPTDLHTSTKVILMGYVGTAVQLSIQYGKIQ